MSALEFSDKTDSRKSCEEDDVAKEEELCQLVINVLFTIMWRGRQGASEDVIKERGQVIACINMLGLNNDLYRSHVELKRRLVELSVQAVLADLRSEGAGSDSHASGAGSLSPGMVAQSALAEHVMQWAYDLIVLDPSKNVRKKVGVTTTISVYVLL